MREPLKENLKIFLIYLLLTCLYFNRMFLDGIVILTSDALLQNYPIREFYGQAIKSFTLPLWNPFEYAGLPFLGQMQTGALYPPNLVLYFALPAPYAFAANFLLHYAMAGFFTFVYLRAIGLRKLPAFAGGAVFALSGFLVGHKPHTAILNASVWLPLILYFLERLRQTVEIRYAAMAALAVGVQLLAGNFQMCFYTYIVLFVFFIYYAFATERGKRARFLAYGAAALALGFIVAAPQIFPVMELSELSYRSVLGRMLGQEFPALYHVYISTLPALIFPFLFGGGAYGIGGFAAFSDMMIPFAGAAAAVFALTVLFVKCRDSHVRFWGLIALLGLVLSLGSSTPLFDIVSGLPVFKDMRSHGRNLLEFSLAVSVLMAVGLEGIFYGDGKSRRYLKTTAMIFTAVLALSLAAVVYIGVSGADGLSEHLRSAGFMNPTALASNINFRNPAILIPVAFLTAYLLWCVIYMKTGSAVLRYMVVAIIIAEGFSFGAFHEMSGRPVRDLNRSYDIDAALGFVASSGPNRVMKVSASQDGASLYNVARGVGSVNSYDQFSIEKYMRLLELNAVGVMPRDERQLEILLRNNILLSALNTKYFIVPRGVWLPGMDAVSGRDVPEAQAVSVNWSATGTAAREDGAFVISPDKGSRASALTASVSLEQGTYFLSFKTRRTREEKSLLTVQIEYPPVYDRVLRMVVMTNSLWSPDITVFEAPAGEYGISFNNASATPIKLKDPKLLRVTPYAPPLIGETQGGAGRALYQPVYDAGNYTVWENLNALPRTFMVEEVVPVADFAALKERFYTLQINPGMQALVYADDSERLEGLSFSKGTASIKKYGLNRVDIDVDASGRGFLVLSDQYYPGWKAYVGGTETAIYETNGVMRGVVVPAGKHTVTFKYLPFKLFFLMGLSVMISIILLYISVFRRSAVLE